MMATKRLTQLNIAKMISNHTMQKCTQKINLKRNTKGHKQPVCPQSTRPTNKKNAYHHNAVCIAFDVMLLISISQGIVATYWKISCNKSISNNQLAKEF